MVAILKALLESKFLFYNSAQVGFSISCTNKRQHVTLQKKIGSRKVITCWLGSGKWFWPSIFS
jgi:hypothetical protein